MAKSVKKTAKHTKAQLKKMHKQTRTKLSQAKKKFTAAEKKIQAFLTALETLRDDPASETHMSRLVEEFEALGPTQGAVLTFAPYISILLSDDPFSR